MASEPTLVERCVCGHTYLTHFALNGRLGDCSCCRCYAWRLDDVVTQDRWAAESEFLAPEDSGDTGAP